MTEKEMLALLLEKVTGMEGDIKDLKQGQQDIRKELRYIWDDIKKLDERLTGQEEEVVILKRLK